MMRTTRMSYSRACSSQNIITYDYEAWWLIGKVDAYRQTGSWFDSRSSCHVGTLGKSFARSCLLRLGVKLRHSFRAVLGAPLISSGLEEAL